MPLRLVLTEHGGEQTERHLLGLGERAENATPVLRRIAELMRLAEIRWFESEGEGSWPALAESTMTAKDRGGLEERILVATGQLRDSLTSEGSGNIAHIQRDELIFGTSDRTARFHQEGTSRMPQRKPLHMTEAEQKIITRELQRWLVDEEQAGLSAAGGGVAGWGGIGL